MHRCTAVLLLLVVALYFLSAEGKQRRLFICLFLVEASHFWKWCCFALILRWCNCITNNGWRRVWVLCMRGRIWELSAKSVFPSRVCLKHERSCCQRSINLQHRLWKQQLNQSACMFIHHQYSTCCLHFTLKLITKHSVQHFVGPYFTHKHWELLKTQLWCKDLISYEPQVGICKPFYTLNAALCVWQDKWSSPYVAEII